MQPSFWLVYNTSSHLSLPFNATFGVCTQQRPIFGGAVTGTDGVYVTHVLYADDLTLTANDHNAMQTMLNRLDLYARRKHLLINRAKSEVVHFNSLGSNLPVFSIGCVPLAHKGSFKYLGMWFHKNMSIAKSSARAQ
eukprot:1154905-Pelagomonas_calceolata.AAC.3